MVSTSCEIRRLYLYPPCFSKGGCKLKDISGSVCVHVCMCVCVFLPIVSVVWLAATRSRGREESERWEEVEGEDRAVPFTLESV